MEEKCIIDNWTITLVGDFLTSYDKYLDMLIRNFDLENPSIDKKLSERFGALSNILNAIIFYDDLSYMATSSSFSWKSYHLELTNLVPFIKGVKPPDNYEDYYNLGDYNFGVDFYLMMAKSSNSALFLSPQRSERLANSKIKEWTLDTITQSLLLEIDSEIKKVLETRNDEILKVGIESNQILPTLTQFVLSEANSLSDIFKIAGQLRNSPEVINYRKKVREILEGENGTTEYAKIKNDLKKLYTKQFISTGLVTERPTTDFSFGINLWFLKLSGLKFSIPTSSLFEKKHLLLLRNMTKSRLEMYDSIKSLKKIAKRH